MRPLLSLGGLLVLMLAPAASAQADCPSRLAEAQGLYVSGAFDAVEAILEPCLAPGRLGAGPRVRAYRLLALTALQQGRLIEAKLAVLSVLNIDPEYRPDPALDPPSYADLVGTVRSQLAVLEARAGADTSRVSVRQPGPPRRESGASPPIAAVEPVRRADRRRRAGRVEIGLSGGFLSFAGDINRNDVLEGYFLHDGPRAGLHLATAPASWVVFGLGVEGAYLDKFPVQRRRPGQPEVRASAQVLVVTADVRLRAWSRAVLSPYLSLSGSFALAEMQRELHLAGGPGGALGVDLVALSGVSIFTEATVFYPLPDDAFDDSARRYGDLFSGGRVGIRWHVGR